MRRPRRFACPQPVVPSSHPAVNPRPAAADPFAHQTPTITSPEQIRQPGSRRTGPKPVTLEVDCLKAPTPRRGAAGAKLVPYPMIVRTLECGTADHDAERKPGGGCLVAPRGEGPGLPPAWHVDW